MFIKFALRNNLLYPCLFVLSLFLRMAVKFIFNLNTFKGIETTFIIFLIVYFIQFIMGLFIILYRKKVNKPKKEEVHINGMRLINKNKGLTMPDKTYKICILIFFSAFFEITGALSRRYFTQQLPQDRYDEYHAKFKSIEIFLASLLCYLTFHINILKHQLLSLIIIFICLIIVLLIDIFREDDIKGNIANIIISSICRVFLDITEKYLFEYDYIDVYIIMGYEAIINCILTPILYISDKPRKEIQNIFAHNYCVLILFLLILYSIFTLFKNIYRRFTIKFYSPMTRAFAESILDPIFIISDYIFNKESYKKKYSFIITLSCCIITVLCSCIYNEVFILYCCGLEYETHYEISKRSETIEMPSIKEDGEEEIIEDEDQFY